MNKCDEILKKEGTEKEVIIPDEMSSISELAFAGSDGLESIYIPDSVTSIGNYAFMNCYALREIRMPESVDSIGAGLFQNCWQLRSVRMPEGTLTLGTDMFENCHDLAEIWLPLSLKEAARTSLSGCRSLRAIHISPQQIEILPPSARYTAVLTYMEKNAEEAEAGDDSAIIEKYVRGRQKSFLDLAINRKSTDSVRYMVSHSLIDEEALREYLNKSAVSGRVEITALLLDSLKDSREKHGLSDDPFE
ncbi:MAG: leucine-rich repeat domain-containing protein [Mogibacterium sp.]|nr:leucine-rich repeat domain-containing protein [Mogibacterium sp.]MBR3331137.1 leucine-rich repeat domain-containing protein [Mogibacterium sp.]